MGNSPDRKDATKEKKHGKKMIAPIVIAAVLLAYYAGLIALLLLIPDPLPLYARLLMILVPLALAGVAIFVAWERIQEIKGGEEDDLSQY